MTNHINHNAMNHSSPLLDLFSFICGVVGGVWTMLNSGHIITASLGGSIMVSFIMGAAGWAGGYVAKWVVKFVKAKFLKRK